MLRESEINAALRALTITRVIVADRRETIAAADRVITIDHGTVVSNRRNIHAPVAAVAAMATDAAR